MHLTGRLRNSASIFNRSASLKFLRGRWHDSQKTTKPSTVCRVSVAR